jgi:hypothetical protein
VAEIRPLLSGKSIRSIDAAGNGFPLREFSRPFAVSIRIFPD